MNIPTILDVVIGLIFIYLLLSLLASEIQELIATVLQWRAQHLRESITNLLAGDTIADQNLEEAQRLTKDLYNHPLFHDMNQEARGLFAIMFRKITWFFSWAYQGITGREGVFGNQVSAPSYIPGETFATALIERLGIAKLVEPLVEAKCDRFKNSIVENISSIFNGSEEIPNFPELKEDLDKIYKQFTDRELTLITAIDKMSGRIDLFILNQEYQTQKNRLQSWKEGLFGTQNELAIVNGGLKPTVEEVADLVNLSSKTCLGYKAEFDSYYQRRHKEVVNDLKNFLLLFDASIKIIIDDTKTNFLTKDNILDSEDYQRFRKLNSSNSDIRLNMSLSDIYEEVIKIINEKIKNNPKAKDNLEAFQQGFSEEGRKLLGSKLLRFRQREIFSIGLLIGFLIVTWSAIFNWASFFITPRGAAVFLGIIVITLIAFLRINRERSPYNLNEQETISDLVNVFFSSEFNNKDSEETVVDYIPDSENNGETVVDSVADTENSEETVVDSVADTENNGKNLKEFTDKFIEKIIKLKEESPDKLNWELSRLGQTFRQYYRALVINNADVDVPFLPSSVKQSMATMVKRIKTNVDRTENEVNQLGKEIEIWFDRSMQRSSGVYKRNAKGISLLIGFLLAFTTNSNSIYIVKRLAFDQELRQAVVKGTEQFVNPENQTTSTVSPTPLEPTSTISPTPSEPTSSIFSPSSEPTSSIFSPPSEPTSSVSPTPSEPTSIVSPTPLDANQLRDRNQIISQILNEQLQLPIGWSPRKLGQQLGCELPKNARDDNAPDDSFPDNWDKLFDKCIRNTKEDKGLNFDDSYEGVQKDQQFLKDVKNKQILSPDKINDEIYKEAQKRYKITRDDKVKRYEKPLNYFVPTAILVMIVTSGKWLVGLSFLVGWLVTAVAISMGASFWFDLLSKVVNVRNTGNKPPSSANQTSVSSEKNS